MSVNVTWPSPTQIPQPPSSWSIPVAGDLNWSTLTSFLVSLGQSAQCCTFQKFGIRISASSSDSVSTTDCIVGYSATGAMSPSAVSCLLPIGVEGQVYFIFDSGAGAGSHNITISSQGGQTIGGISATTYVISTNRASVMLVFDGNGIWQIVLQCIP